MLARVQGRFGVIPAAEAEAEALVADANRSAAATGAHLADALRERTKAPVDWQALKDSTTHLGAAAELVDRVLAAGRRES